jgi:hypothetical protein
MATENSGSEKCAVIHTFIGDAWRRGVVTDTAGCSVIMEFIDQGEPTGVVLAAGTSHAAWTTPPGVPADTGGTAADKASEGAAKTETSHPSAPPPAP